MWTVSQRQCKYLDLKGMHIQGSHLSNRNMPFRPHTRWVNVLMHTKCHVQKHHDFSMVLMKSLMLTKGAFMCLEIQLKHSYCEIALQINAFYCRGVRY